ncbi:MAG TPA: phosphatidylglycerol lysyltransferase domain-containing protein [Polyangia bacterium]|jgi:phosphatidylglycerol lysyltransferase
MSAAETASSSRLSALLRRHGWNATSFQLREQGFSFFWSDDDACVGYVDTGRAWVAAGAPVAAPERLAEVAKAFVAAARAARRRVCFFAVEARFVTQSGLRALAIGDQPMWNPQTWGDVVAASRGLREQLRRARAKGVSVRALPPGDAADDDGPLARALVGVTQRWLGTREMAPMGFLVSVEPLPRFPEHRFYLAERDGRLLAFLQATPIFARRGWLFQNLLRLPEAPNGTSELLIDAGLRDVAREGCDMVTMGLAPLSGNIPRPLAAVRKLGRPLFDFEGLRAFREKLRPTEWSPQFLCFPRSQGVIRSLLDVLTAFAHGSLTRFALRSVLRGPSLLLRLMAVLLVPWTLVLAAANDAWFPHPAVKWFWVGFDVVVLAGMLRLCERWRARLAGALMIAISADALATALEAVAWNLRRGVGFVDGLIVATATLAPSFAAFVLHRARRRRRDAA